MKNYEISSGRGCMFYCRFFILISGHTWDKNVEGLSFCRMQDFFHLCFFFSVSQFIHPSLTCVSTFRSHKINDNINRCLADELFSQIAFRLEKSVKKVWGPIFYSLCYRWSTLKKINKSKVFLQNFFLVKGGEREQIDTSSRWVQQNHQTHKK